MENLSLRGMSSGAKCLSTENSSYVTGQFHQKTKYCSYKNWLFPFPNHSSTLQWSTEAFM